MTDAGSDSQTVIDCSVYHDWGVMTLRDYLPLAWRELIYPVTPPRIPSRVRASAWYHDPTGGKLGDAFPASGPAASTLELVQDQVFGSGARELAIVGYDDAILTTAFLNHLAARTVVRAANDWTIEQWLERDERLRGLALVVAQIPTDAAVEIRRVGSHRQVVGVALGANALGQPFGHPVYEPIYEAAEDLDLPLVISVVSDSAAGEATPVAGGLPATFGEYRALRFHSTMTHVANMIVQGVFVRHPRLRVLLDGCGAAWIPGYLWRLDYFYKMGAPEVPWLERLPSEYFFEHIRVTTYGLEAPEPRQLRTLLGMVPAMSELLVYGSGYPNNDSVQPSAIQALLPEEWHPNVLSGNAKSLFPGLGGEAEPRGR